MTKRTLDDSIKSLEAFIEYAKATKRFADVGFYGELQSQIDGLATACAEAYQVIGVTMLGNPSFDQDKVEKVLDNLTAANYGESLPHGDVLPFEI